MKRRESSLGNRLRLGSAWLGSAWLGLGLGQDLGSKIPGAYIVTIARAWARLEQAQALKRRESTLVAGSGSAWLGSARAWART